MGATFFPDVIVNGRPIAQADIAAEAQNHSAPRAKPGWAWRKAARALTIRALLLEEAERRGVEASPRDLGGGRREDRDEALIRSVLEASVTPTAPSEDELHAVYQSEPERFRTPTLFEASHILFTAPPNDPAVQDIALRSAQAALAVLRNGDIGFEELAKEQSGCGSAGAGGKLGQFSSGEMAPEFEAALERLAPGEVAQAPVQTAYGAHIVRLDARAPGKTLPYDAVRGRIRAALEKRAWAKAARQLVQDLVASAELRGVEFEAKLS